MEKKKEETPVDMLTEDLKQKFEKYIIEKSGIENFAQVHNVELPVG